MFDMAEVGLRQQPQYNAQLEHREWRCSFRLCMLGTTDLRKGMFPYLTDFHFPDTIFRACQWMTD
jgi:hypothetical protein